MMTDYDVIVVGGRPSGATLAARLGMAGLRVLLVDRAAFPSLPSVSSPIIYASTMRLLDEIGADEGDYALNTPKIRRMNIVSPLFNASLPIPQTDDGRDYGYAIDRARFDTALWNTAAAQPTVTVRAQFGVTDLLWEGEGAAARVVGIVGKSAIKPADGGTAEEEHIRARWVVGADGRFSVVARKAGAQTLDQHTEYPTSLYYAYWRGVKQVAGVPSATTYASDTFGIGFLTMDSADETTVIVIEGQSALLNMEQARAEDFYLRTIRSVPAIAERIADAERTTTVRGIRDVGNFYRTAGGAGWALCGDAYLQEDPLDGQGIYNAVYGAKRLAQAILYDWRCEMLWDQALAWYDEKMRVETYYMYQAAIDRVRLNLYTPPVATDNPLVAGMVGNMVRWTMEDPQMLEYVGKFFTRQASPNTFTLMAGPMAVGALVRGGLRDFQKEVEQRLPQPLRNITKAFGGG
jgi:flavin-dependent dehydrogenase